MVIRDPHSRRSLWSLLLIATSIAALCGGCAMTARFKIDRIHQEAAARSTRTPLIFIHGFIGAKLRDRTTQETVWGRFVDAIKRGENEDLSLPIGSPVLSDNRDDLVPYGIYDKVAGVDFYAGILDTLGEVGGYTLGEIDDPLPGDNCFVFYYDWRRDNVESAAGLGRAIARLKDRLGTPDARFDIVAHSMGGLIAEYYLKYGSRDVLDDPGARPTYAGARDINRMVLVGTPRGGTMTAMEALQTGISRSLDPATLFTMPSIYQLLPTDGASHFVDPDGTPLDVDLFDAGSWVHHGWSIFNRSRNSREAERAKDGGLRLTRQTAFLQRALDRARSFHRALERDDGIASPVPIHVFGSDCVPTLERAILAETGSGFVTLFDDDAGPGRSSRDLRQMLFVPGDGTVTALSLLAIDGEDLRNPLRFSDRPVTSTYLFCETHGLLPRNLSFQNNLFHVLFHSPPRAAPASHAAVAAAP